MNDGNEIPPQSQLPPQPQPGYHPQPPPAGMPAPMYGAAPHQLKNNLGVWALVLGMLSFLFCGLLTGIPAIILGRQSQQAEREGLADNGTLGKVGFIVGIIGTALWVVVGMIYLIPVLLTLAVVIPLTTY